MIKKLMLLFFLTLIALPGLVSADDVCVTYLSGIGCPHCARVDPLIMGDWLTAYPNLVVIDYEVFQQSQNAYLLNNYNDKYKSGTGVPVLIISENKIMIGDSPIISEAPPFFNHSTGNNCSLLAGSKSFKETKLSELPGYPKIWKGSKVLIKKAAGGNDTLLHELLTNCDLSSVLNGTKYQTMTPEKVQLSGSEVEFQHAVTLGSWTFQWNGTGVGEGNWSGNGTCDDITPEKEQLTWTKILTLAVFDSINPCELAVLILVLLSILTANPDDHNRVLLSGLSFILAVFLLYLFYGLVIIKFFQIVQALTSARLILYKALAIVAILLGILNIKDFVWYKPGGFMTEMPMFMRPTAANLIKSITSPKGAFVLGAFVTLFLLPCTAGPYIIAGGLLSPLEMLSTIPYLLVYNFVFTLPMLIILFVIYFGFADPKQAFEWKKRNVKYLHLISGLIIISLGIAMLVGWV